VSRPPPDGATGGRCILSGVFRVGSLLTIGLALLSAGLGAAACGSATTQTLPPACALLSDAQIKAATGLEPSGQGGGGGDSRSSCVWALPNSANGSVSVLLVHCGTGCAGAVASLAPAPAYSAADGALGAGVTALMSASSLVVQKGRSVAEIVVAGLGSRTHPALLRLGASAVGRLS
jgi:hypothetical protein